jgi:hypothetical protein
LRAAGVDAAASSPAGVLLYMNSVGTFDVFAVTGGGGERCLALCTSFLGERERERRERERRRVLVSVHVSA